MKIALYVPCSTTQGQFIFKKIIELPGSYIPSFLRLTVNEKKIILHIQDRDQDISFNDSHSDRYEIVAQILNLTFEEPPVIDTEGYYFSLFNSDPTWENRPIKEYQDEN